MKPDAQKFTLPPWMTEAWLAENGYLFPTEVKCGPHAGKVMVLSRFMFTFGLVIIQDEYSPATRYCYEHMSDVISALVRWTGEGDPPGPWIKQKPEERHGPGATGKLMPQE